MREDLMGAVRRADMAEDLLRRIRDFLDVATSDEILGQLAYVSDFANKADEEAEQKLDSANAEIERLKTPPEGCKREHKLAWVAQWDGRSSCSHTIAASPEKPEKKSADEELLSRPRRRLE